MYKITLISLFVTTTFSTTSAMAAIENINSRIRQVTLYQNQAKVERDAEIELAKGEHELIFNNLPSHLDESSLQFSAEGTKGLTILSVDTEIQPSTQHTATLLNNLQQQIHSQQAYLQEAFDQLATIENQFLLLQLLQHGSLNGEGTNTALSFDEFNRLQQFSRKHYAELSTEKQIANVKIEKEQHKLEQLQQEYYRLGGDDGLTQRVVRVQVQAANKGKQSLNLAYNITNAGWQPKYQLNYDSNNNRLNLQYGAQIQQNTNEDWHQIKLILSSALPMNTGVAPEILPWVIDFQKSPIQAKMATPTAVMRAETKKLANDDILQATPQEALIESGIIASYFEIPGAVNITSGKGKQHVVLSQSEHSATTEYAFYPEYQDKILLTVSGKNNLHYPLLAGSLHTAYDNKIIGSGYLPTLLPEENFKQLIGEDQTISVKAEPVKRIEESSGLINKSKIIRIEMAYTLQNNRNHPVDIVVYDRIPQTANKEIQINVTEPDLKNIVIDDNGRYQQKITLIPNNPQVVKKIFTIQYPQDKQIWGL